MRVLQGLRDWWQEVRIASAFRQYEAAERLQNNNNLNRRFDTSQIEREIAVSERSILAAADTRYDSEIQVARLRLTNCETNIKGRDADLITIQRNHESELIALEKDLSKIRSEIQAIRRQKQRAHTDLNNAQSEVREFHDSNTDFFGNRQHIPQHSFLGKAGPI
jgi:chromosome segregation ATPase